MESESEKKEFNAAVEYAKKYIHLHKKLVFQDQFGRIFLTKTDWGDAGDRPFWQWNLLNQKFDQPRNGKALPELYINDEFAFSSIIPDLQP